MKNQDRKLRKFSLKERVEIQHLVEKIIGRQFVGLDLKKLKGLRNIFRIRKGKIRIIFELKSDQGPYILAVERRREDTYKF